MPDDSRREEAERWYEFEQIDTFSRPFYVKAPSLREARRRFNDGVSDYLPTFPTSEVRGRGRIALDQEYVEHLAEEDRAGGR